MAAELRELAPAKINLFLHIVGRRDDGLHLLDSLVAFTALGDRIAVAPAETLTVNRSGPFACQLPPPSEDLVYRAAIGLADLAGCPAHAALDIEKVLPVASGIGGGSSDAAGVLRALQKLWAVTPDEAQIAALAARLGADIPVCLLGRTARVSGTGEKLEPVSLPSAVPIVLANPGVPLSTAAVFQAYRESGGDFGTPAGVIGDVASASTDELAALLADRRNDLQAPAARLCPAIDTVLEALRRQEGCRLARLSGSGATCFAIFGSDRQAIAAAEAIGTGEPGWWVVATTLADIPA